jgi:hypothetical protein
MSVHFHTTLIRRTSGRSLGTFWQNDVPSLPSLLSTINCLSLLTRLFVFAYSFALVSHLSPSFPLSIYNLLQKIKRISLPTLHANEQSTRHRYENEVILISLCDTCLWHVNRAVKIKCDHIAGKGWEEVNNNFKVGSKRCTDCGSSC